MVTTNVRPGDLNYDGYKQKEYEEEIIRVTPGHKEIHVLMIQDLRTSFRPDHPIRVLDLGAGTGLSSQYILAAFPQAHLTLVDFSANMLESAKKKFGKNHSYILGDYAAVDFPEKTFDVILSAIGFHHQTDIGKRLVIEKVYRSLRSGGKFILADLVTFLNHYQAAVAKAMHYHHLVHNASSPEKLQEWAYHHEYLNELATLEDIKQWLENTGFAVTIPFVQYQTALFCGRKA
jgi:tRNA (cmo5U34)-methyltransferase